VTRTKHVDDPVIHDVVYYLFNAQIDLFLVFLIGLPEDIQQVIGISVIYHGVPFLKKSLAGETFH
jgi:hypothetical protein